MTPLRLMKLMRTVKNTKDGHFLVKIEIGKKFRSDEKVLWKLRLIGSSANDLFKDHAFIFGIHALIDFVNESEGATGQFLERNKKEHSGDRAFTSRMKVGGERLDFGRCAILHPKLEAPFIVVSISDQFNLARTADFKHIFGKGFGHVSD